MKTKLIYLFLLMLVVTFVFACKGKKHSSAVLETSQSTVQQNTDSMLNAEVKAGQDTFLYYQRGACFGMCPIFNLTVYTSGRAVYEGKNFVDHIGFYQTQWNDAALQKVTNAAKEIGYFGLQEVYDNPHVTDLPMTRTAIRDGNKLKWVNNRYKGPMGIKRLYDELDSLIAKGKWVATGN